MKANPAVFREQLAGLCSAEAAAAFLTARTLAPSVEILERVRFEGRAFLTRINTLCERIDATKSRIDLAYNHLFELKGALVSDLGLAPGAPITQALKRPDPRARAFFHLLGGRSKTSSGRAGATTPRSGRSNRRGSDSWPTPSCG